LKGIPKGIQPRPLIERFWAKVEKTGGCWNWTGYHDSRSGYGFISEGGYCSRPIRVHRLSYEIHFGKFPKSLYVCHHCDNRRCVRPDHLFLGTHQSNMTDMKKKGRSAKTANSTYQRAKYTVDDIKQMRKLYEQGWLQCAIAEKFGTRQSYVTQIVTRQRWKHI
jgi:hypothetical protein